MAYDTKEMEKQCIEVLENQKVSNIEHLVSLMPFCKVTFYLHKLNELNSIKDLIDKNKVTKKAYLQSKWVNSDNATLQIAVYKLMANEDELDRLNHSKNVNEHNFPGGIEIKLPKIDGQEI